MKARRLIVIVVLVVLCGVGAFVSLRYFASHKQSPPPQSHYVKKSPGDTKIIVFVHGVLGDIDNTWANSQTGKSWPQLIAEDPALKDYDVYVFGYSSPSNGNASNIREIATRMNTELHDEKMFRNYGEIDFITHSMGGLVTKRMLDTMNTPDDYFDLEKVHSVIYISVPSGGAHIAEVASWFSSNPQFRSMSPSESSEFLQSLDEDWQHVMRERSAPHPFPRAFVAYETISTKSVKVVPLLFTSQLSDSPIMGFDYNHVDIVKPESYGNEVYKWARARIIDSSLIQPAPAVQEQGVPPPVVSAAVATPPQEATSSPAIGAAGATQHQIATPSPAIGAPIGTKYRYTFLNPNSLECTGEIIKVSSSEWDEQHPSSDPAECRAGQVTLTFTERESDDPQHYLLYDSGRHLFMRLTKTGIGEPSLQEWHLETSQDWLTVHQVTRVN